MEKTIWSKEFDYVNISVKYFGIWFQFWQEIPTSNETKSEFLQRIKTEYRIRFKNKQIQFEFIYKPYTYTID